MIEPTPRTPDEDLAERRRALTLRSSGLRAEAVAQATALAPAFDWADRVHDTWRWLRRRPPELVWPVTVVALVWVVRKPSRLWSLSWRAWSAWRLWQRVASRWV